MERAEVAILIPAFNEAATVARVVRSMLPYGQPIVVDDCSVDNTPLLAQGAGAIVVRHDTNQGYDGALNSAFAEAHRRGYAYAVTLDADDQHDPALIAQFVECLRQGNDLAIGIRPQPARLSERLFSYYTQVRFGVSDPLCGMKGYRMSLYRDRGWFDSYRSIGTELTLYGLLRKRRFAQWPVPIVPRVGTARFASAWVANYRIMRALFLGIFYEIAKFKEPV